MSFPFKKILCPVEFDDNSMHALALAGQLARQNRGSITLVHIVPIIVAPTDMPLYLDVYKGQEDIARDKLGEIAGTLLKGIECEALIQIGDPASAIIAAAKRVAADVIVIGTHGRRGFSRVLLGSVAEMVLREAPCPVLCVRHGETDKRTVAGWMSASPVVATPDEKLSTIQGRMRQGNFRCMPVIDNGHLAGIITDRDLLSHTGYLEHTEARIAMTEAPQTVAPETPLHEAARLMCEHKIDALPVLTDGQLVGVITNTDILNAFLEQN